jgi:hypothetical protein
VDDDFYAQWYSAKLWQMLPAVYRTLDSTAGPTVAGPLQELITRIGAQAAVLRRSIDRLWQNQSIETCDDWVIPYIGDLLATRIVSCLDARAQRIDVAKTIYYRRRSGTLGLIEELASDIAGRDARAVEFFRRLGRTRHNFDPPIGLVPGLSAYPTSAALLAGPPPAGVIEGLSGPYTRTPAGGYADLRNVYGAGNTGTAFDEFAYTADFRAGRQSIGWQNIPHLGVFIWWLYAYPVNGSTPVQNSTTPNQFTFDPTGRDIPLFAPSQRSAEDFGDNWVSPNEWQLQAPIRPALWDLIPEALYPAPFGSGTAFSIAVGAGADPPIQNFVLFRIDPAIGRFCFLAAPPIAGTPTPVSYNFGFSSTVGAGFDPAFLPTLTTPAASAAIVAGMKIDDTLQALDADATLLFGDSTTYAGPLVDPGANPTAPVNLALVAQSGTRPVLRWTAPGAWTLTGHAGDLVLQGLWLQGADLVIAGTWNSVTLQLCTIDPGTADPDNPGKVLTAIDGVPLSPSHIYIDGQVATFTVQNCITGPIVARNGAFENLVINGSIVQAVAPDPAALQSDSGSTALSRTTVLGKISLHELGASECILDDVATVENSQAGCVRFSTLAAGHNLHAPYRCATVPPVSGIMESRAYGDPNYARVSAGADLSILVDPTSKPVPSVLYGAANGAQPGAFCAEQQALTQRGLAQKLEEYSPISLTPVWVDADLSADKTNGETP